MYRKLIPFLIIIVLLSGCIPGSELEVKIETPVKTQLSEPADEPTPETPAPTATDEPAPLPADGEVSGSICYPSEFIPAMTVFFRNLETEELVATAIVENQTDYSITLPVGQYLAFAYPNEGSTISGAYTQAVPCGLGSDCADHSLIVVDVQPGQSVEGVNLCDWYTQDTIPVKPEVTEQADPAAAGLVLRSPGSGLWQVRSDGTAAWIYTQTGAEAISPDGSQLLYVKDDDIWLADQVTGLSRNLTRTPDRFEGIPQWWPANPSVVVFGSVSVEEGVGPSAGHLSVVNIDGTGYRVLEEQSTSMGVWALSPDGQTIASDTGDQAWLYRLDGSRELFDPAAYGFTGMVRIGSPGYSPDGSQLAWWLGSGSAEAGTWKTSLVVFDLGKTDHQVVYEYTPVGGGGWSTNPIWSADGQWLATIALGDNGKATLWAFDRLGNKHNLGASGEPVWNPDSQHLVYIEWTSGSFEDATVKQINVLDGSTQALNLQPGRIPFGWVTAP